MYGVTAYMIRCLCEAGMGGYSLTPSDIGALTPDQFWLLACDRKVLKRNADGHREASMSYLSCYALVNESGCVKGRDVSDKELQLPLTIQGKSVVQLTQERIAKERERAAKEQENIARNQRRRRR